MRTSLNDPRHHAYQTMCVILPAFRLHVRAAGLISLTEGLSTLGNRYDISPPI